MQEAKNNMNLKVLLEDWEDQDISAYFLACSLGLVEYDPSWKVFRENKHIFWTSSPTSDFLYESLRKMAEIGMIEFDHDEGKYRWNKEFKPS